MSIWRQCRLRGAWFTGSSVYAQARLLSVRDLVACSSEFWIGRAISYVRKIAWGWRCCWILTAFSGNNLPVPGSDTQFLLRVW
jgi:hypothetical protein